MTHQPPSDPQTAPPETEGPRYINVHDLRAPDDEDTCLRPLGLCELGGCCDVCFYSPEKQQKHNLREANH